MSAVWRADEWARHDLPLPGEGEGLAGSLRIARSLTPVARELRGDPWAYLATLATLGAQDLTMARAAEPHLDAVAILAQARDPDLTAVGAGPEATFGVYAARAPGTGLSASSGPDGSVRLSGTKVWCSLATEVSHALVTADEGGRGGLYAVPLTHPGVSHTAADWVSRGLAAITTGTLTFEDVPAVGVGAPGWYLERPGFAWGGVGVAAVWFGGAAALAGRLTAAATRRPPDQVALLHLGTVDRLLHSALLALRDAGEAIGTGRADGRDGSMVAARVRAVVADAAEEVLRVVGHALGPAPLTHDDEHARRVADLTVYLRQHHAERDLATLGGLVLEREGSS